MAMPRAKRCSNRPARTRRLQRSAGIKWRTVRAALAPQKYIVCNADEGDSGTFSDRLVMEAIRTC